MKILSSSPFAGCYGCGRRAGSFQLGEEIILRNDIDTFGISFTSSCLKLRCNLMANVFVLLLLLFFVVYPWQLLKLLYEATKKSEWIYIFNYSYNGPPCALYFPCSSFLLLVSWCLHFWQFFSLLRLLYAILMRFFHLSSLTSWNAHPDDHRPSFTTLVVSLVFPFASLFFFFSILFRFRIIVIIAWVIAPFSAI